MVRRFMAEWPDGCRSGTADRVAVSPFLLLRPLQKFDQLLAAGRAPKRAELIRFGEHGFPHGEVSDRS